MTFIELNRTSRDILASDLTVQKKVLIVGYGSIGKKHFDAFEKAGAVVGVISAQPLEFNNIFNDLELGVKKFNPDIVLIANSTEKHASTLQKLVSLNFKGTVLVEKPMFDKVLSFDASFEALYVAYNLRLSPLLAGLKKELELRSPVSAHIYCGQYLPQWRPGRDYRDLYSAKIEQGGGVLRDLSHELDYTQWLLGDFDFLAAHGGHFSELEINSDDVFSIIGKTKFCPHVTLSVNYLDRVPRRCIVVHCKEGTLCVDMIAGRFTIDSEIILDNVKTIDTYLAQAQALLTNNTHGLCTFEEGLSVLKLIAAAEVSVKERKFIKI